MKRLQQVSVTELVKNQTILISPTCVGFFGGLVYLHPALAGFFVFSCRFSVFSLIGTWCNGSTIASKAICLGSNPSVPAWRQAGLPILALFIC